MTLPLFNREEMNYVWHSSSDFVSNNIIDSAETNSSKCFSSFPLNICQNWSLNVLIQIQIVSGLLVRYHLRDWLFTEICVHQDYRRQFVLAYWDLEQIFGILLKHFDKYFCMILTRVCYQKRSYSPLSNLLYDL